MCVCKSEVEELRLVGGLSEEWWLLSLAKRGVLVMLMLSALQYDAVIVTIIIAVRRPILLLLLPTPGSSGGMGSVGSREESRKPMLHEENCEDEGAGQAHSGLDRVYEPQAPPPEDRKLEYEQHPTVQQVGHKHRLKPPVCVAWTTAAHNAHS